MRDVRKQRNSWHVAGGYLAPLPIPERGAVILLQVSKHQGSPGTCRLGSCFHVQASGPGVGSSEHLIQSTWSCQGCLGNASLLPRGLSWLPAARAQHKSMARVPAAGTSTWQGSRDFTQTQQELWSETWEVVLSLLFAESLCLPSSQPYPPKDQYCCWHIAEVQEALETNPALFWATLHLKSVPSSHGARYFRL